MDIKQNQNKKFKSEMKDRKHLWTAFTKYQKEPIYDIIFY